MEPGAPTLSYRSKGLRREDTAEPLWRQAEGKPRLLERGGEQRPGDAYGEFPPDIACHAGCCITDIADGDSLCCMTDIADGDSRC